VRELKLSLLEKEDHLEEEVEVLRMVMSAIIVIKLVIGLTNVMLVQEVVEHAFALAVVVDIDHIGDQEVEGTEAPQDQKVETIKDIDLLDIKEADVTDEVIAEIVAEGEKESVLTHPDLTKGLSYYNLY